MTNEQTKEYIIKPVPQTALYAIGLTGGGDIPKELKGKKFTSPDRAHKAIESFNTTSKNPRNIKS